MPIAEQLRNTLLYFTTMLLSTMPPKMPKKGSKGIKSPMKPRVKKTVHVEQMSDSESLLSPDRPSQRPVSEHEEGEEGEEASERPGPEATQEDPDEDDSAPARKRVHVSDGLSVAQE